MQMVTGPQGSFAIRWSQTWVDGVRGAAAEDMRPDATWRWSGAALRLDGPEGIVRLDPGAERAELHRRAARTARRICGRVAPPKVRDAVEIDADQLLDRGFVLTDGRRAYAASRIERAGAGQPLVLFIGELPPPDTDLWIARVTTTPRAEARARRWPERSVLGVVAGTLIDTPAGPRAVEAIRPGDLVLTRDASPQPVLRVALERVNGIRLHMAPQLRPVRIAAGALGAGQPEGPLRLARSHRLLIAGQRTGLLFAGAEVLVRAEDLLALPGISVDLEATSVTYVQLLLDRHEILTAGGFGFETVLPEDVGALPELATDVGLPVERLFGDSAPARRRLTSGEAAILTSALA
ncbi:Hint domain-containing protein [Tropicimonas sp. IMCC6043]|uniref:Hint domain-containing protein n=1 Tax=Tropicimonas sp. IMCC6043 TaxID=2510645 RepID=UPI00101BFBB1|nr:Hint domain-containing protein [Tropicimonas sp. IMCC6043]RYH08509.1 Hint domain-containing protein [Tropicimonas sp. IMCC6043]